MFALCGFILNQSKRVNWDINSIYAINQQIYVTASLMQFVTVYTQKSVAFSHINVCFCFVGGVLGRPNGAFRGVC